MKRALVAVLVVAFVAFTAGTVAWAADKEGTIKHIDKDVNKTIKEHGKEIANKLQELGFPKK